MKLKSIAQLTGSKESKWEKLSDSQVRRTLTENSGSKSKNNRYSPARPLNGEEKVQSVKLMAKIPTITNIKPEKYQQSSQIKRLTSLEQTVQPRMLESPIKNLQMPSSPLDNSLLAPKNAHDSSMDDLMTPGLMLKKISFVNKLEHKIKAPQPKPNFSLNLQSRTIPNNTSNQQNQHLKQQLTKVKEQFQKFRKSAETELARQQQFISNIAVKVWEQISQVVHMVARKCSREQVETINFGLKLSLESIFKSETQAKTSIPSIQPLSLNLLNEKARTVENQNFKYNDNQSEQNSIITERKLKNKSQSIIIENPKTSRSQILQQQLTSRDSKKRNNSRDQFQKLFQAVRTLKGEVNDIKELSQSKHDFSDKKQETASIQNGGRSAAKKGMPFSSALLLKKSVTITNREYR